MRLRLLLPLLVIAAVVMPAEARGSAYRAMVLFDNPTAYWRLGEASGTAVVDSSGHGLGGVYESGVTLGRPGAIRGDADGAVSFDGFLSRARFDLQILTARDNLTLEAWVKPDAFPRPGHIVFVGGSATNGYGFLLSDGFCGPAADLYVLVGAVTCRGTPSAGRVRTGVWTHVVLTRSAGVWRVYVNGVQSATGTTEPIARPRLPRLVEGLRVQWTRSPSTRMRSRPSGSTRITSRPRTSRLSLHPTRPRVPTRAPSSPTLLSRTGA